MRPFICIIISVIACVAPLISLAAGPLPRSVLIITQSSPASAGAVAMFGAFGRLNVNSASRIAVYTEHLDLNRFPTPEHQQLTRNYFLEKYRETSIGVVVVDGPIALDLVLSWRGEMWSEVPVVFSGVDEVAAAQLRLPQNVTGFVVHRALRDMVNAARVVVPGLKRVALVGDPPERDAYRRNYKQEIAALAAEVEFVDLTGLAVAEVKERVRALPNDAAVLYTAIFVDGSGVVHTPQSALLDIASVTNRPIVTDAESQLGYGAVGGFIGSLSSAAQEAARLAMRIFDGENASRIPVATIDIVKPIFDGRELKRWNIREDTLPSGSEIRYREFSIWEQYRWQIFAVFAALLFQAAMISGLLIERRRRRLAEVEAHQHMSELAHMNRVATVGELSASFAHEINQPLGAITANGSAALRWLTRATPDLDEARAAVTRVVNEGHRVAELVANIRSMFKKGDQKAVPLDVNELVRAALVMLQVEVEKHRVTIKTDLFAEIPRVSGDRIQLQQVLLNLLMNAMEAMDTLTGRERMLAVKSEIQEPDLVVVTVKDSGSGIDPENVDRIFNAFFTTKSRGMGMGLSICRSIIEAHGGTLSASPGHPHGAIFQIALRTSPPPPPMS